MHPKWKSLWKDDLSKGERCSRCNFLDGIKATLADPYPPKHPNVGRSSEDGAGDALRRLSDLHQNMVEDRRRQDDTLMNYVPFPLLPKFKEKGVDTLKEFCNLSIGEVEALYKQGGEKLPYLIRLLIENVGKAKDEAKECVLAD